MLLEPGKRLPVVSSSCCVFLKIYIGKVWFPFLWLLSAVSSFEEKKSQFFTSFHCLTGSSSAYLSRTNLGEAAVNDETTPRASFDS